MSRGLSWAEMGEEARTEYWASLALRHCTGLGARSCARLLRTFGSAYAAVQSRQRWREAGLTQKQAAEMATGSWRVTARQEWDSVRGIDAAILLWTDPQYPAPLRQLPDAPVLLYCQGDISLLQAPAFAIVGSRRSTEHGRTVAAHMARCLSSCGVTIVSGMALGIDRVAHEAALARIGRSIGVLGTGIDVIYPRGNRGVFDAMREHGLLISEFMPGALPLPEHFPVRNRIISGLALGVLVVEAASRSGSLITARLALEQNREVYAVPGPALDSHCLGCQDLVRQGARPVFSAEDVLRDLADQLRPYGISQASLSEEEKSVQDQDDGADQAVIKGEAATDSRRVRADACTQKDEAVKADDQSSQREMPSLDAAEQLAPSERRALLLDCLRQKGPMQADDLACTLAMPVSEMNAMLVGLEMLGQVRRLPGARYEAGV
ncbi:DNA-processing protein DprA [Desulfovibrio sp. 86]|uniref:DNA protecting protein DprA n=1 Tax=uncultured Desulfovibrio sp. TaxID=167968 RepID=A0A212KYQ9_9BACT|nr:DNA-processing protein DprA [Desulfovibrio sp. 86]SCM70438.1 DNA protecting protein DprA [uncultured Desulfovibrio sp.]VZH32279.1 DNA protecting protein DprA [Desulfovibrio sp. 86]